MKENIGGKIKYHRRKAKMTQSDLAKGIISESYLSKIENGKVIPPNEILDLLANKLKVNPYSEEKDDLDQLCHHWFNHLFQKEKHEAKEIYNKITANSGNISNTSFLHLVELHKLRYFNLIEDNDAADQQYRYLKSLDFEGIEKYYFLKFSGYFQFNRLFYCTSLDLFLNAKRHLNANIPEREKNDLFYMIALAASKLRKSYVTLRYINKALNYYQKKYNIKKCSECHILLGITYQRINEFEKSMENYLIASNFAHEIGDINIQAICKQNLGKIHSIKGESKKAIDFYLDSFKMRDNLSKSKQIIPISSLVKEYYNIGDILNTKKWIKEGIKLSKNLTMLDSIYIYEFKAYNYLINKDEKLVELITKKIIPFLEDRSLYFEKLTYLKILAKYYYVKRRYKLAADCYENATITLTKIFKE